MHRLHHSSLAIVLPALFASAGAAALPTIGPEFAADAPAPMLGRFVGSSIDLASEGGDILTVFDSGGDIRGMLVDASGTPKWSEMALLAARTDTTSNYYPSVAAGGGMYLVSWVGDGVWLQLFDAEGAPAGDAEQVSELGYYPSAAWLGDRFLLAFREVDDAGGALAVISVDPSGAVGDARLLTDDGSVTLPNMVSSGSRALVTWPSSDAGIDGLLLDEVGDVSVPRFSITTQSGVSTPVLASDGAGFLVAFTQSTPSDQLMAVTVSATGSVSAPAVVAEADSLGQVTLGANAQGYIAVWKDYSPADSDELHFRHLSAGGVPGTGGLLTAYSTTTSVIPTPLGRDSGYWVAYQEDALVGTFTDQDLHPEGDPTGLSLVQNSQDGANLVWDGQNYVLAWADERDGDTQFSGRAVRINTAGRVLDAPSLELTDETNHGSWFSLASAGGGISLVTWLGSDSKDIYFRTLHSDGTAGATWAAGVSALSGGANVASNGEDYLSVYAGSVEGQFFGQRFDASAEPLGEPFALVVPADTREVRLLAGADDYLLVIGGSAGMQLAEVSSDGSVSAPQELGTGTFPSESVVGGGKTVVVWMTSEGRVARFWSDAAWASDPITLAADGMWGQTTWDGTQFAAVWQDADYHSHWATFDVDGNLSAAEPLFPDEECVGPKLASNGQGQAVLNCVRYNRDYSRRLVNYLLGDPLPDTDPPPVTPEPPDPNDPTTEPEPEPTGPAPSGGAEDGNEGATAGAANDPTTASPPSGEPSVSEPAGETVTEPAAAAEAAGQDAGAARDGEDTEDTEQELVNVPPAQSEGGCAVSAPLGARGPSGGQWWSLTVVAFGFGARRFVSKGV